MTSAEQLREMIEKDRPRPYDLASPSELKRLHREAWGYLKTCHGKHGTDWDGRRYAMDALEKLWRGHD